ncbi:MAG: hypothetical protein ACI4W6_08360 [Acutalibacteraceae bacterium]
MLETIFDALMLVLMLFGLFSVVCIIFEKLLTRKCSRHFFAVVAGRANDETLPEQVYAAFVESNLLSFFQKREVIVVDYGVEEAVKNSCRHILGDERNVIFCKAEEISDIIGRFG